MKVLVTGSLGYVGSVVVPTLIEAGHSVTGLDSGMFKSCRVTEAKGLNAPIIIRDIRDVHESDLKGFDAVVHLAALSNDALGSFDPKLTDEINRSATLRLAHHCRSAGVKRFIFASSCGSYGAAGNGWVTEESPLQPVTPYSTSKVEAEIELRELADSNFSPTYVRAATVYGMSEYMRFDPVVNNLTCWALNTGKIFLVSDGMAWRPIVHVQDLASAYLGLLETDKNVVHNRAFNVGTTAENYLVREIAEVFKESLPSCEIEYAKNAFADERCYRVDCNLLARETSFRPQWTVKKGIQELCRDLRVLGEELREFDGPRFDRLAHLKQHLENGTVDETLRMTQGASATAAQTR